MRRRCSIMYAKCRMLLLRRFIAMPRQTTMCCSQSFSLRISSMTEGRRQSLEVKRSPSELDLRHFLRHHDRAW